LGRLGTDNGERTTDNEARGATAFSSAAIILAIALLATPCRAAPDPLRPQYRLDATVAPGKPQIAGTLEVAFTNRSDATLQEAVFFLFPNRFSEIDPRVNDLLRQYLYPEKDFDPGRMELLEVLDGGTVTDATPVAHPGLPRGTVVTVPIAPLAPGAMRRMTLRFRTDVPHRFGSFGEFEDQLTLVGGWYPYLAGLEPNGQWALDAPPGLADFDVTLSPASALEMVLNGRYGGPGTALRAVVPGVHYLSLIAAPRFVRSETTVDGTRIVLLQRPKRLAMRISFGPSETEILLSTLRDIVTLRPAVVPAPAPELLVVEAPLRLHLTAAGEGDVVVSDRALKLREVLRPFHEQQLAQAVYAELLRPSLAAREPAADYYWVAEGVSYVLAERFMERIEPERRTVYDWIDMFNVFAVVDRFENTPKIPFVGAFFPRGAEADPLHDEVWNFNRSAPPGRAVLVKLRDQLGAAQFDALLDTCVQTPAPLRACAAAQAADPTVTVRLEEWTLPYPAIDYSVADTDFNRPEGEQFRSTVAVRRRSSRPFAEPVRIRLHTLGGDDVDLYWKSGGDVAIVSTTTPRRVYQAVIDPDRELIDDDRSNNAWPPRIQVVLDSADIEVSSTEVGISALAVGRLRYAYRKDLAVAGFYTNRAIGFTAGGRLHWGKPIDRSRFRHNLYAFYTFAALDKNFREDRDRDQVPAPKTPGHIGGIGFRYNYGNVFWTDNPTGQRRFRLYADWFDKSLGSDYDYADWGYIASATLPLWNQRTLAAGEIFNGFSSGFDSVVPNQALYSLGGSRSIRGIGAEEDLARNILVVRTELRRQILPELDLNLHDILVLRRTQVKLLVDAGGVSNSAGRIYDVGRWACGVGVGLGLIYDFFGFFPSAAYFEIATRVDDPSQAGDVQFLFGTNQAF
jgi:hypothetical protein